MRRLDGPPWKRPVQAVAAVAIFIAMVVGIVLLIIQDMKKDKKQEAGLEVSDLPFLILFR